MRASFGEEKNRNVYSRFSNPNNTELVDKLCQLEGAEAGHTFATGVGAIFSSFAALIKEVIKCKDNKQVRQVGIEWCIDQSKELIDFGVPFLHYYSMGKSDNIHSIAKEVF